MKIITYGKNIDVTPALKEHAEQKVSKLSRFFNGKYNEKQMEVQISMEVEKDRHIVEVTAFVKGLILRGEEETDDMYASIDGVVEKLERQIRKYKTKIHDRLIERKQEFKEEFKEERTEEILHPTKEDKEEEFEPQIVKTKRFAMKPMNLQEACMQMDLLGHDFFVFHNAESEETNVVYKRRDGNYGLIEPTF